MTWSELLTRHVEPSSDSTDFMDCSDHSVCMVFPLQDLARLGRIVHVLLIRSSLVTIWPLLGSRSWSLSTFQIFI